MFLASVSLKIVFLVFSNITYRYILEIAFMYLQCMSFQSMCGFRNFHQFEKGWWSRPN